jgi:hypothetical protein
MKVLTLGIDDSVSDKFAWLLEHFGTDEVRILDQSEYQTDDEYLRSIPGMVESIQRSRAEPVKNGIGLEQLDW